MVIVIDLGGDGEEVVKKDDDQAQRAEEDRKRREAWLEWVRWNEQVVPQVVPAI